MSVVFLFIINTAFQKKDISIISFFQRRFYVLKYKFSGLFFVSKDKAAGFVYRLFPRICMKIFKKYFHLPPVS